MLSEAQIARTAHTITDPQMLRAEIERAAREGVAFDVEENWSGVCAVAAPIRDRSGAVVASVSVVVSVERFTPERRKLLAETVRTFANKMSYELGHSAEG